MGRSVSTPPDSIVAYTTIDLNGDSIDQQDEFDFMVEEFTFRICELWPSFQPDYGWAGREDRVLASNGHALAGVSEYCGLVAFWLTIRETPDNEDLANHWLSQAEPKFKREFGTLRKVATASNGESFYERVE